MYEMPMPGVVLVRYRSAHEMEPSLQGDLVDAIRSAARTGPVVVLLVAEGVRSMGRSVKALWAGVIADETQQACGLPVRLCSLSRVRQFPVRAGQRVHHGEDGEAALMTGGLNRLRGQLPLARH